MQQCEYRAIRITEFPPEHAPNWENLRSCEFGDCMGLYSMVTNTFYRNPRAVDGIILVYPGGGKHG